MAWAVLSLLSGLWSLATPIAAAPDEPAHFIKAASVARGQLIGETSEFGQVVEVPQYAAFTQAQTCFAFSVTATADCAPMAPGDPGALVSGTTTAGLYNPVYYVLVGWPSLMFADQAGLYAMRIVSGILSSLLLAGVVALIFTWTRRMLPLIGLAFAITPMVLFLNGILNPSALETAAILAVFVGMVSILRFPSAGMLIERCAFIAVAGCLAANARGLSLVWLAMAVLVPLIFTSRSQLLSVLRSRPVIVTIGVVALGVASALSWLAISNSLGAGVGDTDSAFTAPSTGASPIVGFTWVLQRTFDFAEGMIGILGWLDTSLPLVIFAIWAMVVGTMLVSAVLLLTGRRLLITMTLLGCLVLVPALIQAGYVRGGGLIWQGRYNLPAFVCLLIALGLLLADQLPRLDRRIELKAGVVALLAWAGCHVYGFAAGLRRYTVGAEGTWRDVFVAPAWSPPFGVATLIVVYVVIVAVGATSLFLLGRRRPEGSRASLRSVRGPVDEASLSSQQVSELHGHAHSGAGE